MGSTKKREKIAFTQLKHGLSNPCIMQLCLTIETYTPSSNKST